jgi:hypothetical protein
MQSQATKLPEDVAERAHKMPRNSALLYRNRSPKDINSPHYRGLIRLENGQAHWVDLWVRRLDREQPVLEVKLVPKK